MTEDQIKAIAEEYAKIVMNPHRSDPNMTGFEWQAEFDACVEAAEDILRTISDRYCVIEKRIVIDEYNKTLEHRRFRTTISKIRAAARRRFLQFLFGDSMFNQNEE